MSGFESKVRVGGVCVGVWGRQGWNLEWGASSVCLCVICEGANSVRVPVLAGLGRERTNGFASHGSPCSSWRQAGGIAPVTC